MDEGIRRDAVRARVRGEVSEGGDYFVCTGLTLSCFLYELDRGVGESEEG